LGSTIPHETWGRFGSSKVFVKPAAPGTGVIAGSALRAVLEAAGVKDILSKCYGATNPVNVVKAAMDALKSLRSRDDIARVRGVTIE
ncbi:MAG: 30S ribosomal protein S5, partial [Planctomycetes bacterium]|nr:30S ribosomal protein S5 [Planctomycetota bacterium]